MVFEYNPERELNALSLYLRGCPPEVIAAGTPILRGTGPAGSRTVSRLTAHRLVQSGVHALLTHVLLGRDPAALPEGVWPPEELREKLRAFGSLNRRRAGALLREWVDAEHERAASAAALQSAARASSP